MPGAIGGKSARYATANDESISKGISTFLAINDVNWYLVVGFPTMMGAANVKIA